jgi:hypothetical protein
MTLILAFHNATSATLGLHRLGCSRVPPISLKSNHLAAELTSQTGVPGGELNHRYTGYITVCETLKRGDQVYKRIS